MNSKTTWKLDFSPVLSSKICFAWGYLLKKKRNILVGNFEAFLGLISLSCWNNLRSNKPLPDHQTLEGSDQDPTAMNTSMRTPNLDPFHGIQSFLSHRIHGTGIFTYIYHPKSTKRRYIYNTWILWISSTLIGSAFHVQTSEQGAARCKTAESIQHKACRTTEGG